MYGKFEEETLTSSLVEEYSFDESFYRFCECLLAFSGLVILFPLLFTSALLIWCTSRGPVLFRQQRVGRGGRTFTLLKFRTMYVDSKGLPITAKNDRRITPFGKILRIAKLDELPELFNVLRGDMSFVGPRPEVVELVDFSNPLWQEVLKFRPGITDPVTLQFRNEEDLLDNVIDKDKFYREVIQPYKLKGYLKYLQEKSFVRDLKISVQTVKVILFPRTAPPLELSEPSTQAGIKKDASDFAFVNE